MIAVLDWELSSLGHPFADLAHLCMMYLPIPAKFTVAGVTGIPSEEDLTKTYSVTAGIPHPIENWSFFKALSCFRMAGITQVSLSLFLSLSVSLCLSLSLSIIRMFGVLIGLLLQGVYARGLLGNASSEEAKMYKHFVQPLAKVGCYFTK